MTAWWRRRNKREITLLSLLHFSPLPPSAPRYSSSNYLKETSSLLLTLSLALGCPAGKFCLSDQTDNRSAQHRDTLPWLFFFYFFFGITIKGMTQTTREKDGVKKRTLLRRDTLSGASMAEHKTKRFCSGGTPASDSSASLYQQQASIFFFLVRNSESSCTDPSQTRIQPTCATIVDCATVVFLTALPWIYIHLSIQ